MGRLSVPPPKQPDPEPPAATGEQETRYITWRGHLYEIVGLEDEGLLHVINCQTMHPLWLEPSDVKEAVPVERTLEVA